jgi:hypothetical protein
VCSINAGVIEDLHPSHRQVHVDEQLQAEANTTSRSSVRQAA